MFSDFFGSKKEQGHSAQQKVPQQKLQENKAKDTVKNMFGPFNRGPKGLAEKSPLIKHVPRKQEDIHRRQSIDKNATNSENQAFLKDVRVVFLFIRLCSKYLVFKVITSVLDGEGVGWLKLNRLKKLMEDESYRSFVVSKLNKTLDKKIAPDDHIDDVVS